MLYEEVEKYARLSGDKNAKDTSVSRIGGYLDGYDKGVEILDKVRAEIEKHCGLYSEDKCKYCYHCHSVMGVREILEVFDKYKSESEDKE